ncbi:hypothetical protein [Limosilactobacillus reuteri]|uniref:hypothetical protein n=1 Tax=Limosilactobacillus reuteri TaxID=1598 RepID=UPI00155A9982|nr:hypothetical protein [Limosilactobacillus reuteri]
MFEHSCFVQFHEQLAKKLVEQADKHLASFQECSEDDLIKILQEFRKKYQFTIDFSGFDKEEWRQLRDAGLTK